MKSLSVGLSVMLCLGFSTTAFAYGGGSSSSTKACDKPKFSQFTPADKAEVKPAAEFSFIASANTYPDKITVTAKDLPVAVKVEPNKDSTFTVSGTLPDSLKNTYARININAEASGACKGSGGWLVKILE